MPSPAVFAPTASDSPQADRERGGLRRTDPLMVVIAATALLLLVIGFSFLGSLPGVHPAPVLLEVSSWALFSLAGMIARHRRPHNRIGPLMLLAGFSMWATSLTAAPVPVLVAIGTAVATLPLALTLHLVLAFPSGRLRGRLARVLVAAGYVTSLVLQAPLYLIGDGPLALTDAGPALTWIPAVQFIQSAVGVSALLTGAVLIADRAWRTDALERKLLGPVVWYRIGCLVLIAAAALAGRLLPGTEVAMITGLAQLVAIMGIPLVFLVGLLFGSFGRAGEVDEMVARIGAAGPTAARLTSAVADALGDPDAVVVFARTGRPGFVDAVGVEVDVSADRTRQLHPVRYDGRVVGGILHRHGLVADDALLDVLAGIVGLAIDQQRLVAEQHALVAELQRSRRRLLQAEDAERRRIARDLHDGAQQHLVVLGMTARQLSRTTTDPGVADTAAEIADGVSRVLAEFRDLIAGIMPAPLQDRGLGPAVELLAERMPIPTRVSVGPDPERPAADVESTLYFLVAESLTNVIKHAGAGTAEVIIRRADRDGRGLMTVTVSDDGRGGADPAAGHGLRGIADRVEAIGGALRVDAAPDGGTRVYAEVPCG